MEDLTGTKFTRDSFYFELQRTIQSLAEEKGLQVRYVNRDFTSQKCSNCGYIDKNNRISQDTFLCKSCGFTIHADNNAAINIAIC
jgi:transposase